MAMHWDCCKKRREPEYFLSWFFLCLSLCRLEYVVERAQVNVSVEEGQLVKPTFGLLHVLISAVLADEVVLKCPAWIL